MLRTTGSLLLTGLTLPLCLSARPLADHGDTPLLIEEARHDARLTDLFAMERNGDLVLILCSNPTVPPGVAEYLFPPDLTMLLADGNLTAEDLQPPEGVPEFVYVAGQTLKMDTRNVLVYCHVDVMDRLRDLGYVEGDAELTPGGDYWVLTLDGSVQQVGEEAFQTMLEATQQRLGQ